MKRTLASVSVLALLLAGGIAAAQGGTAGREADTGALALAKRQASEATLRSQQLDAQAERATSEAARARDAADALVARIQAAEADITAAEARIRIVEDLRAAQRARLAERQQPVARLTAALQTMARRPAALALVQPGSLDDTVHVRALLASTLPVIRARTESLRSEMEEGDRLRRQADVAAAALMKGQQDLKAQRLAFARLEADRRRRSEDLAESASYEADRALALGEEARDIAALITTRDYQARIRERLAALPGPMPRPARPGSLAAPGAGGAAYILPVEGRVIRGMGEISDGGVHARGLTLAAPANAPVVAPRDGRIAYAGAFRGYGDIVIIDHGGGWTSLVTNLAAIEVGLGQRVRKGEEIGRAPSRRSELMVELRKNGRPFPIAPLLALGG